MSSEPQYISPRVNSALFPKYQGKVVRLTCKVLSVHGDRATVMASDGGELHVQMSTDLNVGETPYVELIGTVSDSTTMKLMTCLNMLQDLDMTVVDHTIRLMHDPKFAGKFWGP